MAQSGLENDYKVGVEYSQDTDLVNKQSLNSDFNRFANIVGQRELAGLRKLALIIAYQYRALRLLMAS